MRKITITDSEENKVAADLIRYFQYANDLYLIYSLGESDKKNYRKLYLVKIYEELGLPVVQTIKNDNEWKSMQSVVKKALKEIKSGNFKMIKDMDPNEVDGIQINNPRFFKLEAKLTDILSSNYLSDVSELSSMVNMESDSLNPSDVAPSVPVEPVNESSVVDHIEPMEGDNAVEAKSENGANYYDLYLATKRENESSSQIIQDLIGEIQKYKEKFGELE